MMADASDCDGFNHSVAAEEKEKALTLGQKEEDEHSAQEGKEHSSCADLEAKKQRLLEELESALLPGNTKPKQDLAPAIGLGLGLGLGLGFEVIDETALVETLSLPPASAAAAPSGKNVKKQSSSRRRRAKKDAFKHKTGNGNGKKTAASSSEEEEEEEAPNTKKKKNKTKYSKKEMEALRFANVEKQRAFWNVIHAGLEPVVASEYDTLLALPAPLCQLPNKKQAAPPILSVGAANGRWRYMNVFVH